MQNKLNELLNNSHSPYSKVKVSSIVIADGKEYQGINVENASFGATNCAERSAMFGAISDGHKAGSISDVHLTSNLDKPLYPCGICLQVMSELGSKDLKVHVHFNGESKTHTLAELLPHGINKGSFGWK